MTEFRDLDLTGATFERVRLRDARVRAADLSGLRVRGAELTDVEISGELRNVVVLHPDPAAPQLRLRRLGRPGRPRRTLAVAPARPAVGRGARLGRRPVGP